MIRFRRLTLTLLNAWLVSRLNPSSNPRYRLRVWREDRAALPAIRSELKAYITESFEDARQRLRRGFEDTLSPFNDPLVDPAANYPQALHRVTLQGYLGETLAVLAVEHWGAHGHSDWQVPAFLFRFHDQEFQHLELINEKLRRGEAYDLDATAEQRPGRTGDDGLAFRMNAQGAITDLLVLEAKCLSTNRPSTIAEAYEKLAGTGTLPSGIRELINILDDYDTPQAGAWQEALIKLRADTRRRANRLDGMAYACGQVPTRQVSWLSTTQPDRAYIRPFLPRYPCLCRLSATRLAAFFLRSPPLTNSSIVAAANALNPSSAIGSGERCDTFRGFNSGTTFPRSRSCNA